MKYIVNSLILSFCLVAIFYFIYHAVTAEEGLMATCLRIIAALIMAFLFVLTIKEINLAKDEHVIKWYNNDEPKGLLLYMLKYGILLYGFTVGYVTWVYKLDFGKNQNLLQSAISHIIPFLFMGIFGAWITWLSNKSRARKLGLDN